MEGAAERLCPHLPCFEECFGNRRRSIAEQTTPAERDCACDDHRTSKGKRRDRSYRERCARVRVSLRGPGVRFPRSAVQRSAPAPARSSSQRCPPGGFVRCVLRRGLAGCREGFLSRTSQSSVRLRSAPPRSRSSVVRARRTPFTCVRKAGNRGASPAPTFSGCGCLAKHPAVREHVVAPRAAHPRAVRRILLLGPFAVPSREVFAPRDATALTREVCRFAGPLGPSSCADAYEDVCAIARFGASPQRRSGPACAPGRRQ
jgi:hypothetical protein